MLQSKNHVYFIVLLSFCTLCFIVFYQKFKKEADLPLSFAKENNYTRNLKKENNSRSFCENNGEWSRIDDNIYFKNSASFYFYDLSLINLNFLSHNSVNYDFEINLKIELIYREKKLNFFKTIKSCLVEFVASDFVNGKLHYRTLDAKFNLIEFLTHRNTKDLLKVDLSVLIKNRITGTSIVKRIKLKTKKSI